MYERHFSLSGSPFRLHPDPQFFYNAGLHREVLSAMCSAFDRAKSFLVLSGELGTGKTTLLQGWAQECESRGIRMAQLANTQLEAGDLVHSICHGFGVSMQAMGTESAAAALCHAFAGLPAQRAVLLVDEAQNLDSDGFRVLLELAIAAKCSSVHLRICLSGQPELRDRLAGPELAALRNDTQATWHLGSLTAGQTEAYVKHRLARAGWSGKPSIDAGAFEEIQQATQGVPRRINVLCNRLLLMQFLSRADRIDRPSVADAALALEFELDGSSAIGEGLPIALGGVAPLQWSRVPIGGLMLAAAGRSDHIKAMSLLAALRRTPGSPEAVIVSVTATRAWSINQHLLANTPGAIRIALTDDSVDDAGLDHLAQVFSRLLDERKPRALVLFDGNAVSLMCAKICCDRQVPLVHVAAMTDAADPAPCKAQDRTAIGALADLRFDSGGQSNAGVGGRLPAPKTVGNLLIDAVRLAVEALPAGDAPTEALHPFTPDDLGPNGYAVVAVRRESRLLDHDVEGLLALLRSVTRDIALVWPIRLADLPEKERAALQASLAGYRIACIDELGHHQFINLLIGATCVLTDSTDVMEEAVALRLPCLSMTTCTAEPSRQGGWMRTIPIGLCALRATRAMWDLLFRGAPDLPLPGNWDGHAGDRIGRMLTRWWDERPAHRLSQVAVIPPG